MGSSLEKLRLFVLEACDVTSGPVGKGWLDGPRVLDEEGSTL